MNLPVIGTLNKIKPGKEGLLLSHLKPTCFKNGLHRPHDSWPEAMAMLIIS